MIVKCGIDLIYLPRFKTSLQQGGEIFLRRVFLEKELTHLGGEISHLAGIFAAKEAVVKALSLKVGSWHNIHVDYKLSGAPQVEILNHKSLIINHSLSISHDGNYVIAQFIAILKK